MDFPLLIIEEISCRCLCLELKISRGTDPLNILVEGSWHSNYIREATSQAQIQVQILDAKNRKPYPRIFQNEIYSKHEPIIYV